MKSEKASCTIAADELASAEAARSSSSSGDRRRLSSMLGAVAALLLLFAVGLVPFLERAAISEFHSYILFIPLVVAYWFWTTRYNLPQHYRTSPFAAIGFSVVGCAALPSAVMASTISDNDRLTLVVLSFVSFVTASGFIFLGRRWMMVAVFPFTFLLFMVPMPDGMVRALETASQHASVVAAELFFRLGNTPHLHEGVTFQLPNITLEVAQECSGIRSSWVLFITSILSANLFLQTTWKRVLLVALVIPLGILRNGFRVWVIGALCVRLGPQMIHNPIHHHGGPLFFALSLIPLFALIVFLRRSEHKAVVRLAGDPDRIA
jgi:exosortase C (VPDSG-CTERM-specific)